MANKPIGWSNNNNKSSQPLSFTGSPARIPVRWRERLIDNLKRRKFLGVRFPFISRSPFHVVVLGLLRPTGWMEFVCWNKKAIFEYFITKIVVNNEWIALRKLSFTLFEKHSRSALQRWFPPACLVPERRRKENIFARQRKALFTRRNIPVSHAADFWSQILAAPYGNCVMDAWIWIIELPRLRSSPSRRNFSSLCFLSVC